MSCIYQDLQVHVFNLVLGSAVEGSQCGSLAYHKSGCAVISIGPGRHDPDCDGICRSTLSTSNSVLDSAVEGSQCHELIGLSSLLHIWLCSDQYKALQAQP